MVPWGKMSWSARPCQMSIFPPSALNRERSGSSVAMVAENSLTDWANNWPNWVSVRVCQFQDGFCCSQVPSHATVIGNGAGPVTPSLGTVPARPPRLAPGSSPYHSYRPSVLVGPAQISATTFASVAVMVPQGVLDPTRLIGSQRHLAGSAMKGLVTPSWLSQASTTAAVKAFSLQAG